jgi:lysophospholipase L1-like esterase
MLRAAFIWTACCLFLGDSALAQKKVIAVIGSSTAYGFGATPAIPGRMPDSSWVNLTKRYYQALGLIDTIYNLGNPGTTTYSGMPSDFVPPANRPAPDPAHNITKALSFVPDIVIINFPSNDFGDDFSMQEVMFNFRIMYAAVLAAGKACYVTTTQPRDNSILSPTEQENLRIGRDSILAEFGVHSLDFYDPVSNLSCLCKDSLNINPGYDYDGTHVNNAGHRLFFDVVVQKNILASTQPPFALEGFSANLENRAVLLNWIVVHQPNAMEFTVERSSDSLSYSAIYSKSATTGDSATYTWTDPSPFSGRSFYRLQMNQAGTESYSKTVSVVNIPKSFRIAKMLNDGHSLLTLQILTEEDQLMALTVVNSAGNQVLGETFTAQAPLSSKSLPLANLPAGVYFLRIASARNDSQTISFVKF